MFINTFITQSLSPAIAISGIGLLVLSLGNRINTIGTRIRHLNSEMSATTDTQKYENARQQVELFLRRARLVRNALFMLYAALGLMMLTAVGLALTQLGIIPPHSLLSVISFLSGLALMVLAMLLEAYETSLSLKAMKLDIAFAHKSFHQNNPTP